jgi:hypothetical protein
MPGITPNEGENAVAEIVYRMTARTAAMQVGLWAGTWNGDETRTFAAANDSVLTKITATGLGEQTLTDASWVVTGDTATYADRVFTNSSGGDVVVNGYYVAFTQGTKKFLHIERDPNPRTIANGAAYTVGLSNTVA